MSTLGLQGSSSSLNASTTSSFGKEGVTSSTFAGKDAYGGSTYNKGEGQQYLGSGYNKGLGSSLQTSGLTNQSVSSLNTGVSGTQFSQQHSLLPGSKYTGAIQFGAIPGNVTSNYSVQRFENVDSAAFAQHKTLWAGETGPITMQHQAVCLAQEPLVIKPEAIVVPQPPVVFQPDAIQIPQPPLMFQPEPIAIPLPPLTIQPEPVVIERPPLVIQPESVVLRRPDIQMNPSFSVNLKYGCDVNATSMAASSTTVNGGCPPGTVPASSLGLQQQSLASQSDFSAGSTSGYSGLGSSIKNAARYEAATMSGGTKKL